MSVPAEVVRGALNMAHLRYALSDATHRHAIAALDELSAVVDAACRFSDGKPAPDKWRNLVDAVHRLDAALSEEEVRP